MGLHDTRDHLISTYLFPPSTITCMLTKAEGFSPVCEATEVVQSLPSTCGRHLTNAGCRLVDTCPTPFDALSIGSACTLGVVEIVGALALFPVADEMCFGHFGDEVLGQELRLETFRNVGLDTGPEVLEELTRDIVGCDHCKEDDGAEEVKTGEE